MDKKDIETKEIPKTTITNNFSTVYSLTNGGDQELFITDTVGDNLYNALPYGITAELLVRNKSKNGSFTDNLQVDGGDIIEFKLSLTNTSTTITLYSVQASIDIAANLLSNLYISTTTIGTVTATSNNIVFSISNLPPGTTAIATYEFVAVGRGILSFSQYIYVKEESTSQIRKFNFSTLPSVSIINAPNLSSVKPVITMEKHQKLIQSGVNNDFISTPIKVINGDIILFRLYVGNTKSSNPSVYNLKIVDKLSNNLSYIENTLTGYYMVYEDQQIANPWGNMNFNSTNTTTVNGKLVGGSIEWNMDILYAISPSVPGAYKAYVQFQCEVVG